MADIPEEESWASQSDSRSYSSEAYLGQAQDYGTSTGGWKPERFERSPNGSDWGMHGHGGQGNGGGGGGYQPFMHAETTIPGTRLRDNFGAPPAHLPLGNGELNEPAWDQEGGWMGGMPENVEGNMYEGGRAQSPAPSESMWIHVSRPHESLQVVSPSFSVFFLTSKCLTQANGVT